MRGGPTDSRKACVPMIGAFFARQPPGRLQTNGYHRRLPCQGTSGRGCQQPPAEPRSDGFTEAIPKEQGPGFSHTKDHCRKVLISFGQLAMPSSAPPEVIGPRPDEGPQDSRHFFKQVHPPVGPQLWRCSCVRPNRPPEQDVATAPMELGWAERPRTAPTRLVRLPTLRRPTVRSPLSLQKGAGLSAQDPRCPVSAVLDDRAPDQDAESFRRDAASRKRGPPCAPPTNGHPNANPDKTSSADSKESNTSDLSTSTAAGVGSNEPATGGGSSETLSVDTRGSTELSSSSGGGGGRPLDEDSSSTSEFKTHDEASSPDA